MACVEFAIVAPVFLAIVMGVAEASTLFNAQNEMANAAREGARLASMDRTGMLDEKQPTNAKITTDIRNFLTSNGLQGDQAVVHIVAAEDSTTYFDLDDPHNDLQLFELRIELPYSAVSGLGGSSRGDLTLSAKVIFRNARAVVWR